MAIDMPFLDWDIAICLVGFGAENELQHATFAVVRRSCSWTICGCWQFIYQTWPARIFGGEQRMEHTGPSNPRACHRFNRRSAGEKVEVSMGSKLCWWGGLWWRNNRAEEEGEATNYGRAYHPCRWAEKTTRSWTDGQAAIENRQTWCHSWHYWSHS